jgi:hypothetical protein
MLFCVTVATFAQEMPPPDLQLPPAQQGKQTIAVYMAGEEPEGARGVHSILGGELARTISESDRYTGVDRTDAILQQLTHEHIYQRSGAVSDDQIKNLGQQLGVQYLCISNINPAGRRSYYLDVRLIDVVTAEIIRTATANSNLRDASEMRRVAQTIAYELIEPESARQLRLQRKKQFFYMAVGLDAIGGGLLTYGLIENYYNVKKHRRNGTFKAGDRARMRRDVAYVASGIFVASGVTIHILF